ncbi:MULTISPECIES: hypothetical protein [Legionella]|uniref:Transmembrane protein n=1 Tax=Legionella drozanskii LLAP-1 TaxID=1212489 RepID=A0A0W0SMS0_9GAMM|nr:MULTISPECIES: hypothetical protein [Legionella]KTC84678.1 hypothetical protein Ldro_2842 [Legionella drozanskii LLAP-1]PJE07885.1 MAG: hypothetical protein CK430_13325 [Legionella sp.]
MDNSYVSSIRKNHDVTLTISLLILFFLISSIPLFQFGFSGDDLYNSQIKGMLITQNKTLFAFTKGIIIEWINTGRFYPISFITTYPLFYLIGDNVILYNLIHWIATLVSLGFVCLFLFKLSNKKEYSLLFCSLVPFCWFLSPNSPWVAQAFLLPLVISFIMLTLINYINFIQQYKIKYLFYMLLFFSLSLLTYEVAVIVPVLILALHCWAKEYDNKSKLIGTTTILLLTLTYGVIIFYLRQSYGVHYEGTSLGSIHHFIPTFFNQFMGEFPLVNLYLFHEGLFYFPFSKSTYFIALLLLFYSTALIYRQLNKVSTIPHSRYVFLISLLLQITPAVMIGLSKRYQLELRLGMSHIPVILQQIGLCMMLALIFNNIISFLSNYFKKKLTYLKLFFAILMSSMISISFVANQLSTNWYNQLTRYSRDIFEKSLKNGLFNNLPPDAMIITHFAGAEFCWNSTQLRAQLINRGDLLVFDLNGKAPFTDKLYETDFAEKFSTLPPNNFYYLDYEHLIESPKSGYALLAHINNYSGKQPQLTFELENIKIFYSSESKKDLKNLLNKISKRYQLTDFENQDTNLSGFIKVPIKIAFSTQALSNR